MVGLGDPLSQLSYANDISLMFATEVVEAQALIRLPESHHTRNLDTTVYFAPDTQKANPRTDPGCSIRCPGCASGEYCESAC
jgi:hypothetical protein